MKPLADKIVLDTIRGRLLANLETIAVSESVTAGLLQAALASAQDASDFFHGGITAYNIGQKSRHLFINAIHAAKCDCVSKTIAEQMAKQVAHLFTSDWGIGITGYATPSPRSSNKLFCYYAISYRGKIISSKKIAAKSKESLQVQLEYVGKMLLDLSSNLKGSAKKRGITSTAKKHDANKTDGMDIKVRDRYSFSN